VQYPLSPQASNAGEQGQWTAWRVHSKVVSGGPRTRGRVVEFPGMAACRHAARQGSTYGVAGLYNSAPENPFVEFSPPATSTWPFRNNVAVWPTRATLMLPVSAHVPEFAARAGDDVLAAKPVATAPSTSERTVLNEYRFPQIMADSSRRLEATRSAWS
jgi:hypothetical protein